MRRSNARRVESLVLASAVLALGFSASYAPERSSAAVEMLHELLRSPLTGALLLIAGGCLLRALQHRIASIVAAAAGSAWAAVGVLDAFAAPVDAAGITPEQAAIGCVACLALGTLIGERRPKRLIAYLVCSTSLLLASAGSVAYLAITGIAYSTDDLLTYLIPATGCAVLGAISLGQLLRYHRGSLDWALGQLIGPIAITGTVAALLAARLIAHRAASPGAEPLDWLTAASTLLVLCLTLAALMIARLLAEVAAVRRSSRKWKRLLRRQREIMHERTKALRRTQARYKELFANVPAPVLLTNPSGEIIASNPAMLALLGADSEQQLKNVNFASFYPNPEDRAKLIADWSASDRTIHQGEVKLRRLDGELRSALFTSHAVRASRTGELEYLQGTFTDITDLRKAEAAQRKLEANLRLAQKLESVGRLAAGIAHEINTPMQYIGDNVYFLRESFDSIRQLLAAQKQLLEMVSERGELELANELRELEADADIDEILEVMPSALTRTDEGIKSINRIVAAMKELAHPGDGAKASTDINAVINTAVTVTRNAHKTVAKVDLDLGDLPNTLTYKNELCQVFINLIVNAAHAIESAQKIDRREGTINIRTRAEHDHVVIHLSDNGCGIPDSVMDKIFDPFFTTKEVGKGTGQGLALARTTIVEKHEGQIAVQSVVGEGSTFTITLPMGDQKTLSTRETS